MSSKIGLAGPSATIVFLKAARIDPCGLLEGLIAAMSYPRASIPALPSGIAVGPKLAAMQPLRVFEDLIIDYSDAEIHDPVRQASEADGLHSGIGVSGGAEPAHHGPSITGFGLRAVCDRRTFLLSVITTHHDAMREAATPGQKSVDPVVETTDNAIEYADIRQIAWVFDAWDRVSLRSCYIDVARQVSRARNARCDCPLVGIVVDVPKQKGMGRRRVVDALDRRAADAAGHSPARTRLYHLRHHGGRERRRAEDLPNRQSRFCALPHPRTHHLTYHPARIVAAAAPYEVARPEPAANLANTVPTEKRSTRREAPPR